MNESTYLRIGPAARRLAALRGLDLATISPTGPRGWITKADIESAKRPPAIKPTRAHARATDAPLFHEQVTVDITSLDTGEVDLLAHVAAACAKGLQQHPAMLRQWTQQGTHTASDPLIVAERVTSHATTQHAAPLNKLATATSAAEALRNGTSTQNIAPPFKIIDVSATGVHSMTAALPQSVSAILTIGAAANKPGVKNGGAVVKNEVELTLTSDHRVIDGALAAAFLSAVREALEPA